MGRGPLSRSHPRPKIFGTRIGTDTPFRVNLRECFATTPEKILSSRAALEEERKQVRCSSPP